MLDVVHDLERTQPRLTDIEKRDQNVAQLEAAQKIKEQRAEEDDDLPIAGVTNNTAGCTTLRMSKPTAASSFPAGITDLRRLSSASRGR